MRASVLVLLPLGIAACATLGGPPDVDVSTVALRSDASTTAAQAAAALEEVDAGVALLAAPRDAAWFASVAQATGRTLSGPAHHGDLGLAFLAGEVLGDTAIEIRYEGGTFMLQDALYDLGDEQFLDLMAFAVERPEAARPMIAALLQYVATDVMPTSAVVVAVAVPSAAVGDSVARMFNPAYFDALRCANERPDESAGGIRLFYGPEARVSCRDANATRTAAGARVHASLVVGQP